jgi:hypothetical protein
MLLLPPTLLVALLIAGPVSASGGPTPTVAAAHVHSASTSRTAVRGATARDASSCAVVVYPLSADPTGEGQCAMPTDPRAEPSPAASSDPNTQAVTQSIGMEVRAGSSVP